MIKRLLFAVLIPAFMTICWIWVVLFPIGWIMFGTDKYLDFITNIGDWYFGLIEQKVTRKSKV